MPSYARVQNGVVAEIIGASGSLSGMFHPSLTWVPVDPAAGVAPGWGWDGTKFTPPAPEQQQPQPLLATLQAQIESLQGKVAQLAAAAPAGTSVPPAAVSKQAAASPPVSSQVSGVS